MKTTPIICAPRDMKDLQAQYPGRQVLPSAYMLPNQFVLYRQDLKGTATFRINPKRLLSRTPLAWRVSR